MTTANREPKEEGVKKVLSKDGTPIAFDQSGQACMLGGVDRRTLFLMAAEYPPTSWGPEAKRSG